MSLLEEWKEQFGINHPFLLEEVVNNDLSYDVAKTMLSRYVKKNEIRRYSQGVYYFPKYTEFGETLPAYQEIISKRFMKRDEEVFGYVSGRTLLNQLSLSMQVPSIMEISTNLEKTRKRKVELRNQSVVLRKPVMEITKDNVCYLQFLDIFKYASLDMIEEGKDKIFNYYKENDLNFSEMNRCMLYYSSLVSKKIKESGIYDELASK